MFTHLEQISTLVLHRTCRAPRATRQQSHQDTIAIVMKSGIDLHVRTNRHAGSPPLHRAPNPSAKPSGHRDTIATLMTRRGDLHVHSPRTNRHAGSPPLRRAHNPSARPSGHRDTAQLSAHYLFSYLLPNEKTGGAVWSIKRILKFPPKTLHPPTLTNQNAALRGLARDICIQGA